MAAKASEDPAEQQGPDRTVPRQRARQLPRPARRRRAGSGDARSGSTATRTPRRKPQENFGRELMELFTRGVGYYTEDDVYAAARVFTGWNLSRPGDARHDGAVQLRLQREPARDEREDVQLSDLRRRRPARFRRGRRRRACRTASISSRALAMHPETARRLATKLYAFFVSETDAADPGFIDQLATVYLQNGTRHQAGAAATCSPSPEFQEPSSVLHALLVARRIRRARDEGNRLDRILARQHAVAARQHGAAAVRAAGRRRLGRSGASWFSTGAMLARMNFASHAGGEPEVQPGDGRRRREAEPAGAR